MHATGSNPARLQRCLDVTVTLKQQFQRCRDVELAYQVRYDIPWDRTWSSPTSANSTWPLSSPSALLTVILLSQPVSSLPL